MRCEALPGCIGSRIIVTSYKRKGTRIVRRAHPDLRYERKLWRAGLEAIAGVDEAGVGPMAGPVVAAAVIFPVEIFIKGVNDSKQLPPERREELLSADHATRDRDWSRDRASRRGRSTQYFLGHDGGE